MSSPDCSNTRVARDATADAPLPEATRGLDARGERRLVVLDPDGRTLRGLLCLTSDRSGFCQS